jgi:hypothetical protein
VATAIRVAKILMGETKEDRGVPGKDAGAVALGKKGVHTDPFMMIG